MNILAIVESIKALSAQRDFEIVTKLACEWHRSNAIEYGAISEHTTLTHLQFKHHWREKFVLTVGLTHKCPIGNFRDKFIRKAPYYCKQCAQCIISADQGIGFGLPVDREIVPKLQISIAGPTYKKDVNTDFDIGNMVLTRYDGWVHKCSKVAGHTDWTQTKQTLKALPFKCKLCRQWICEEGMTFEKLTALAKVMGVKR